MRLFIVALISLLCWASIEALHLYSQLRKRVQLELAAPLAATQIMLWGLAAALGAVMVFVIGINVIDLDRSPLDDPLSSLLLLTTVFGVSSAMWCAFFPPVVMRRHFERPVSSSDVTGASSGE